MKRVFVDTRGLVYHLHYEKQVLLRRGSVMPGGESVTNSRLFGILCSVGPGPGEGGLGGSNEGLRGVCASSTLSDRLWCMPLLSPVPLPHPRRHGTNPESRGRRAPSARVVQAWLKVVW